MAVSKFREYVSRLVCANIHSLTIFMHACDACDAGVLQACMHACANNVNECMFARACMFTCSRNLETAIYIMCIVGTTCALSILELRHAAGALQSASIAGSCAPGSPINHAKLPRSALILANCRFQVSNGYPSTALFLLYRHT
jgi:hypothetical protein